MEPVIVDRARDRGAAGTSMARARQSRPRAKYALQTASALGEYMLFVLAVTFKLYLFAKLSGNVFAVDRVIHYIQDAFLWVGSWFEPETRKMYFRSILDGVVMVSIGSSMLLSFWTLLLSPRARRICLILLNMLVTCLAVSDLIYYRYFSDYISVAMLQQAGQVGSLWSGIAHLVGWKDLWFVADLAVLSVVAGVVWILRKMLSGRTAAAAAEVAATAASAPSSSASPRFLRFSTEQWWRIGSSVSALVIGLVLVATPIRAFLDKDGGWLFDKTISNARVYNLLGLLGFHAYDVQQQISDRFFQMGLSAEELTVLRESLQAKREAAAAGAKGPLFGAAKGKNVMIVQMESIERFVIGTKINGQEITPNLNRLLGESLYFDHFYHQVGYGRTADAEFLTNVSMYPVPKGTPYFRFPNLPYRALPQLLQEQGYATDVFHAYDKTFWNRYIVYPNLGFERFHSINDFEKKGEDIGWTIGDEYMLAQSAEKIRGLEEPFFSFLITLTSHYPYDMPADLKKLNLDGYKDAMFRNYIHAVHYVDYSLGEMIDRLKADGLWDDTLLVMYGDHDSGFIRQGGESVVFAGNDSPAQVAQMKYSVPLIMKLPKGAGATGASADVVSRVGGQIDLAPTILYLLGLEPGEFMLGKTLFSEDPPLVVFRNRSFTDGDVFYKSSIDNVFEKGTCFDVHTNTETALDRCSRGFDEAGAELLLSDHLIMRGGLKKLSGKK